MGAAKRYMDEDREKSARATRIAMKANVLSVCEIHELPYSGERDIKAAYRLGNHEFTNGDLSGVFESRKEMADFIKQVVDETSDRCPTCANNAAAD